MLSVDPSPQVNVGEGSHPERVKVYGPGVEKTGLKANEPTYFTVDCSEAGQGACRRGREGGSWAELRGPGRVGEVVRSPSRPCACLPQGT